MTRPSTRGAALRQWGLAFIVHGALTACGSVALEAMEMPGTDGGSPANPPPPGNGLPDAGLVSSSDSGAVHGFDAGLDGGAVLDGGVDGGALVDAGIDAGVFSDGGLPTDGGSLAGVPKTFGACSLFPKNNYVYRHVTDLPVAANSSAVLQYIAGVSADAGLAQGASALVYQGSRGGIPFNVVDSSKLAASVVEYEPTGQFLVPYQNRKFPIPSPRRIEGEPNADGAWDRHVLLVDTNTCMLYELFLYRTGIGWDLNWHTFVDGSATFDLNSNAYNKDYVYGGAEAAGLPMVPAIYTYDEVQSGEVRHAIRAAFSMVRNTFVWPATHTDGRSSDVNAPPMGSRFRLKASFDLSVLKPNARVIARALQVYGLTMADTNGGALGICGEPDPRWDDSDLATLGKIHMSDLELVDTSSLMVSSSSMEARFP